MTLQEFESYLNNYRAGLAKTIEDHPPHTPDDAYLSGAIAALDGVIENFQLVNLEVAP